MLGEESDEMETEEIIREEREKRLRTDSDEVGEDEFTKVNRRIKRSKTKIDDSIQTSRKSPEEPYVVSITAKEILPKQFGLTKLLHSEKIKNILKISYKSPYKVLVEFENRRDCDGLIKCGKIINLGFRCQMADEINLSYGLVRQVDLDVDEKEALENLKCEYEIVAVRRLKRLGEDGKWLDSETVRVSIKGPTLPPYVFGYGCRFKVEPYTFPVSQCSVCWRFGHLSRACPANKPVCPKCGKEHKNCETTSYTCVNCKGPHLAMYKQCPMFIKEKEIRNIMRTENCTYKKALMIYLDNKHKKYINTSQNCGDRETRSHTTRNEISQVSQPTQSYSNVVKTSAIIHREIIESDEETLSAVDDTSIAAEEDINEKSPKKKNRKKKKQSEIYIDENIMEQDINIPEEEEEKDNNGIKKNIVKIFWKLVKKVQSIFYSGKSFEDKVKSVCSIVFEECIQFFLESVNKDNLLRKVITFLSDKG